VDPLSRIRAFEHGQRRHDITFGKQPALFNRGCWIVPPARIQFKQTDRLVDPVIFQKV
jgi:hypothetical protein